MLQHKNIMASFSFTLMATATTPYSTFISKTASQPRFNTHNHQTHRLKISCNVKESHNHHEEQPPPTTTQPQNPNPTLNMQNIDRRNLLLGITTGAGLYNFTNLPPASAIPIRAPSDISNCHDANAGFFDAKDTVRGKACCPPVPKTPVKDFVFPTDRTLRTRPAVHRLDPNGVYVRKFKAAIKAMKDLPDDHPHSFKQQAKIHCAYCNGGYTQVDSGFPDKELQVHNTWLFFPFHRWYLYFFERILGKLIDDPSFALPYWNWDNPGGMEIPAIFEDGGKANPLFDGYRNVTHLPSAIADLEYDGGEKNFGCLKQINGNLSAMYRQMFTNAPDTTTFFGGRYVAGKDPIQNSDPSVGSIEAGCHTAIHRWVGDSRMPNNEDLGNFYSAGYDTLFYIHHANVDRMWTIWKSLNRRHREPTSQDWLDASFVFYDENEDLVRVYNRDCVKIENLKYTYEKSEIPWAKSKPVPGFKKSRIAARSAGKVKPAEEQKFPVKLEEIVKVLVKRPATIRSKEEKEEAAEMLVLKGIQFDGQKFVKFDVFVDDASGSDGSVISAANSEFVGSFGQLPHNQGGKMAMTSGVRFGLTEVLEDIEAEDDEFVLVTIVPKSGCEDVTISEIKIELVDLV